MPTSKFAWLRSCAATCPAVLIPFLLLGCTSVSPRLTAEDRAQIGHIAIAQAFEQQDAGLDTGEMNLAQRAAAGFAMGLLPPTWIVGGPLATVPAALARSVDCEEAFSGDVKGVEKLFSEAVVAVRPDELLQESLRGYIFEIIGRNPTKMGVLPRARYAEPSAIRRLQDQGIETILVVEKLQIMLTASKHYYGHVGTCVSGVRAIAESKVIRVRDGTSLATGAATGFTLETQLAIPGSLSRPESLHQMVRTAVGKLPRSIACAMGFSSKCGLSREDFPIWPNPLHRAAAYGTVGESEALAPSLRDSGDEYSRTPLHVAAYFGQHNAMRALVKAGADPNALEGDGWGKRVWLGNDGYDIVTIAAVANDVPTLKLALELGCEVNNRIGRNNSTALITAALLGHAKIVQILIRAGAQVDLVNNLGWTALIETIVLGNGGERYLDTLRALIDGGANVNKADRDGQTPLTLARQRGYAEMVAILERAGAR